jgi:MFS family permease
MAIDLNTRFAAIRIPEFRNLLGGRFFFIMGMRMLTTTLIWWLSELTDSPFDVSLLGLSEIIPAISLALYAGHVIDISDKRKLLLRGIGLYLLSSLCFVFLAYRNWHLLSGRATANLIYAIVFLSGIIRAFVGPAFNAMLGTIVSKEVIPNAITINQSAWLVASVSGHAMGGFLIEYLDVSGTLRVIAVLVAISCIFLWRLHPKPPAQVSTEKKNTLESVREGLAFVFRTKELLAAMALDMFAVFFGGAVAMIPFFVKKILHSGAEGYGLLNAASDIGSAISVLLLTVFPMKKKQGYKLLFAVAGFGISIIIFAFSRSYWISFLALVASGTFDGISVVIRGTILQLKTPEYMKGRVLSVSSMFVNSSNELGQFESGLAERVFGLVRSVAFGGVMTLGVAITTWFKAPRLRKMEY